MAGSVVEMWGGHIRRLEGSYPVGYDPDCGDDPDADAFRGWLSGLRDARAKARIASRIRSATLGDFGDVEPVGDGVDEMRIHHGPGYRLYYLR